MFKIYLAVAHEGLEKFLKSNKALIETKLNKEVNFVGTAVYREAIVQGIKEYHPDVILIREGIPGSLSLTDLVYQIRIISPTTRIIFIAGDRKPGDAFLSTLTQYGVYDLLIGNKVNAKEMVKRIIYPNTFADVMELIPKTSIDERSNKQLYESPDIGLLKPMLDNDENNIPIKPLEEITPTPELIKPEPPIKQETPQNLPNQNPLVLDLNKPNEDTTNPKVQINQSKPPYTAPVTPINEPQAIPVPPTEPIPLPPVEPLPPINKPDIKISMEKEPIVQEPVVPQQPIVQQPIVQEPIVQTQPITSEPTIQPLPIVQPLPITPEPVQQPIAQQPIAPEPVVQQQPIMQQPTESIDNTIFAPRVNVQEETNKKSFRKKNNQKKVSQQIITFIGGKNGCGTSQIAFNTGLLLAEQGLKILYLDLNENFSSIDAVLQFGLEDLGIDTMLKDIETGNYPNITNAISSAPKVLQMMDKKDSSFKTYSRLSPKFEYACFSMQTMYQQKPKTYKVDLLKELNMFLLMNLNYDVIILDAPSDLRNELTKISLIYSNRIFFTTTQDYADLDCLMRNLRTLEQAKIGYKEKTNFILNKYIAHTEMDLSVLNNYLINTLRFDNFRIVTVPNIAIDIINATNSSSVALWKAKDKNFKKALQDIANIILN